MEPQKPELETVEQMEEKVRLPNQCLGITFFNKRCTERLPKGQRVCPRCQKRINSSSKLAIMSSGKGRQERPSSLDI